MSNDGPSTCVFSDDRLYRYWLAHRVADINNHDHKGFVNFVMLNPSTADEKQLDPTLRRCRGFTQDWGYGEFHITNLFAFRATRPKDMKAVKDPVGPDNDRHVLRTASLAQLVILGWGAHGSHDDRSFIVKRLLRNNLIRLDHIFHLGVTGQGEPRHPLYLPSDAVLVPAFP